MSRKPILTILMIIALAVITTSGISGQYKQSDHKILPAGVIPVKGPGYYDKAGSTYMLQNDVSGERSAIFLGKDVTLDLNGYCITYADGNYGHVKNYGFEDGVTGWDLSESPGAEIENTSEVHAFIGNKLLRLRAGDRIRSSYVYLPLAARSYYAMCGITGNYYTDMGGDLSRDMRISVFVEDENGNEVRINTRYGDSTRVSCPVMNRSAQLGGGFVFAHLNNLPAGNYRVCVKAETDCLVDEIDIRPAMDVGIGIVEKTHPMGHYDHLYNRNHAAFFDYTADVSEGIPVAGIPVVTGEGTITIKNGIIKSGTVGILSWGIQSTAGRVRVILDNVKIVSAGINTTAADLLQATITNCTFDIQNPFIINRHGSEFYAVDLRGEAASEVSYCSFYGGQGCLCFNGKLSSVHHNYFYNRQTVTNHYSVMAMGDGSSIFENIFKPEIGSGLEIFRHRNINIFNNEFYIHAAPPSCEYNDHYSTNAVRIADYGASPGSPEGSYGTRVYNNKFYITGKKYRQYPNYIPMASAFFYSASAGDNEIFGNDIFINQEDPDTDAEAFAFYIGNASGGILRNNRIITNVTPIWVASSYGRAENTRLTENTIIKAGNSENNFTPVRMGSYEQPDFLAAGTEFHSNEYTGIEFRVDATDQHHFYSVFWTLLLKVSDTSGRSAGNRKVEIFDCKNKKILTDKTDNQGNLKVELPEYYVDGSVKIMSSPYTVAIGNKKMRFDLKNNCEIGMTVK